MYILLGVIFIALGIFEIFVSKRQKSTHQLASDLSPVPFQELKDLLKNSDSTFTETLVDIEGTITSDSFITAPYSHDKCIFYDCKEKEVYQKKTYYYDKSRKRVRWVNGKTTISEDNKLIPFFLSSDYAEKLLINPEGAKIDTFLTHKSYIQKPKSIGHDYKILGYEKIEYSLPINKHIYIIGMLKFNNAFEIQKPNINSMPFIISTKTKDKFLKDIKTKSIFYLVAGIITLIAGFGFIIAAIIDSSRHNNF